MKIKHLLLFLLLISSQAFAKDVKKGAKQSPLKTSSRTDFLATLDSPHKRTDLTFDFGTKELMSDELYWETISVPGKPPPEEINEEAGPSIEGLKRIFKIKNFTDHSITINDYDADSACISLGVWTGEISSPFPHTVPSQGTIEIVAVFSPYIVVPGTIETVATLVGGRKKSTLATFRVKGVLNRNIAFFPKKLRLESSDQTTSSLIHLKIDRHIQAKVPSKILKVTSSNPSFIVSSIPPYYKIMGVTINKDTIELQQALGDDLPHDLDITFKVELSKSAPLGKSTSKISLNIPGLPAYIVFKGEAATLVRYGASL